MYARKRLDIGGLDLAAGLAAAAVAHERDTERLKKRVEGWFSGDEASKSEGRGAIACLSVRSGLDNYLAELALPRGSEVLMSALTIPDMWRVVEHHGLVPVPVDVDAATLAPRLEHWRRAAGPKTGAAIVAHLFGARVDLDPLLELARARGWKVLEDCAQAFTGADFKGHPRADVSMFSFGPIKTSTALAGGVLVVRDREILARMRARQAGYPVQSQWGYFQRLLKYSCLVGLTKRPVYAAFVKGCELAGKDHDRVIAGSVRGFAGGDFFQKIRHRPSPALLALLARRLERYDAWRVSGRVARARRLLGRLPESVAVPAAAAPFHSFWVFTILCDEPARAVARLRAAGFDATQAATLSVVPAPRGREDLEAREARQLLARMVYLPAYPEMPERKVDEIAAILRLSSRVASARPVEDVAVTRLA